MKHFKSDAPTPHMIARTIPLHVDLGDERAVIVALSNARWQSADYWPILDDVIAAARLQRRDEIFRDSRTGIAEVIRTTAAVIPAALAFYGVWCALPEPAMAMTLDDAKGVMVRGLYALCAFLVIAVAVWLSALVLFRKDAEDAEYETYDTSDLERRRRNAGGE